MQLLRQQFRALEAQCSSFAGPEDGPHNLMERRTLLKLACGLSVLGTAAPRLYAADQVRRIAAPLLSREFLLLGRSHLFAVHRMQYAPGHHYQIVLRLRVPDAVPRRWRRLRRKDQPVLLRTAAMDLRDLRPGAAQLRQLQGSLSTREGEPLLQNQAWHVLAVQVYAEIDPQQRRLQQLEYFLFGHRQEWYGMHVIGGAPDFEQIIRLARLPQSERLRLPLDNTAVEARRSAAGRHELHFATLPEWSP